MIHGEPSRAKILSPEELDEVRDLWGCGVPLSRLATKFGLALAELERQLAEHRRQRVQNVTADLQRRIEERQKFSNWARQRGRRPGSADG